MDEEIPDPHPGVVVTLTEVIQRDHAAERAAQAHKSAGERQKLVPLRAVALGAVDESNPAKCWCGEARASDETQFCALHHSLWFKSMQRDRL